MASVDDQLIDLPPDDPVIPVEVGDIIQGKFRIGRIIGFGGMATVAAGHHLELDQPIAIKFLHPDQAARADSVRRFLSEARAAARLSSPHVARVLDVGSAPTSRGGVVPFMVMELLEGVDLDAYLMHRGRLPVAEAVEYVLQACSGVAEAHALGIIHRDLKPGNLFLTRRRDGTPLVKLLDFGISKNTSRRTSKDETAVTGDREMMGSPRYMSPEQVRSAKDVDPRTDVWSLGVILYELLCGVPPFQADTVADTLVAILHAPPRTITNGAAEVPQALVDVVMRCLQKKPDGRHASVEALATALAPFRGSAPIVLPPLMVNIDGPQSVDAGVSVRTVRGALPAGRMFLTGVLAFGAVGLVLIAVGGFGRLRATHDVQKAAASAATVTAPLEPPGPPSAEPVEAPPPVAPPADEGAKVTSARASRPAAPSSASKPAPIVKGAAAPRATASSAPRHRTDW